MRNIDNAIWRDEWFAAQELIGRLLWIGIVTRTADDQGRFLDNSDLIKSDIFPMDKMSADEIDLWITFFCTDKKLVRYEAGGKKLIQVVNWWKYQAMSNWMGESKYQAPEGWEDCFRYHVKGGGIKVSKSWALRNTLCSLLGSPLRSGDVDVNVEDDVDVNVEDEEEEEGDSPKSAEKDKTPAAAAANQYFVQAGYSKANKLLLQASQLAAIPNGEVSRLDGVAGLIAAYGDDKCLEALTEARQEWTRTPKKTGGGTYSVLNFAWVDWASEFLATGIKRWEENKKAVKKPSGGKQSVDEARVEMVAWLQKEGVQVNGIPS